MQHISWRLGCLLPYAQHAAPSFSKFKLHDVVRSDRPIDIVAALLARIWFAHPSNFNSCISLDNAIVGTRRLCDSPNSNAGQNSSNLDKEERRVGYFSENQVWHVCGPISGCLQSLVVDNTVSVSCSGQQPKKISSNSPHAWSRPLRNQNFVTSPSSRGWC